MYLSQTLTYTADRGGSCFSSHHVHAYLPRDVPTPPFKLTFVQSRKNRSSSHRSALSLKSLSWRTNETTLDTAEPSAARLLLNTQSSSFAVPAAYTAPPAPGFRVCWT